MTSGAGPQLSDEVAAALAAGQPVVALETTLVSHGFPGEQGVQVALAAEARVRQAGAVPATVGIVDGPAGRADRGRAGPVRRGGRVRPQVRRP